MITFKILKLSLVFLFTFSGTLLFAQSDPAAPLPQVSQGVIKRVHWDTSEYIGPRNIDIWLPPTYNDSLPHAVLYMHDGKVLFDANISWNHQEWKVDETAAPLILKGQLPPIIVVGIWNAEAKRRAEYMPQKAFESMSAEETAQFFQSLPGEIQQQYAREGFELSADAYLKFITTELKPWVDEHFRTLKDPAHTRIAGSSYGGLISLYALCEYPDIFGGAACLSTHWPGSYTNENNPLPGALLRYLDEHLPLANTRKIYFDYGTATLDSLYEPHQQKADAIMKAKGYLPSHWVTKKYTGADHSENSWSARLDQVLLFLFTP